MDIATQSTSPSTWDADWLVVPVADAGEPYPAGQGVSEELAGALKPVLARLRESKDFVGGLYETLALWDVAGVKAERVLLVGAGRNDTLTQQRLVDAYAAALRHIGKQPREHVAVALPAGEGVPLDQAFEAAVVGATVGSEGPGLYKSKADRHAPTGLTVFRPQSAGDATAALMRARVVGDAVNFARLLVNTPPEDLNPQSFVDKAKDRFGKLHAKIEVMDEKQLQKAGMNCLYAVGKGSAKPPRMLTVTYEGKGANAERHLALVGKGITFDSGGLSLKPSESMMHMKCDMAGGATALAATLAIVRLGLPVKLTCVVPLAENMTGAAAYKLGDVLTAANGRTIEIMNTDAEGRLALADALCHAVDRKVTHIVDLATLTGACLVALGEPVAGLMTNDQTWCDSVRQVADQTGELVWQLPMFEEYDSQIDSPVADMKNVGGRPGGAITAAKILEHFVAEKPWTHIDVAGPAFADKPTPRQDAGGTGYFVRSLVALAERFGKF